MNEIEIKIISKLENRHKGKDNAITYKNLAFLLGINERELRNIVSDIVTNGIAPLAGTSDAGYYFPADREEFDHSQKELNSRALKILRRKVGQRKAWIKYEQEKEQNKKIEQLELML
jgi:hypothetical protein